MCGFVSHPEQKANVKANKRMPLVYSLNYHCDHGQTYCYSHCTDFWNNICVVLINRLTRADISITRSTLTVIPEQQINYKVEVNK